jgi:recombination protein RecA
VKNKVAPPFRRAELEIMFGKGISWSASLLDAAVKYGIIDKKGAWYTWGEEKVGQGRENAKTYLEQNPDTAAKMDKMIREKMFLKIAAQSSSRNVSAADTAASDAAAAKTAAAKKTSPELDNAGVISADDLF